MKRVFKWIGIALGGVVTAVLAAGAYVWIAAGSIIERKYDLPETTFAASPETADLDEGRRIARVRGCFDGCHGEGVSGNVFNDDIPFGRIVAPDLALVFGDMSDREIDLAVRHGLRRDGKSMTVMPSASFHHLTDEDLNDVTAFIRSQAPGSGLELETRFGVAARFFIWNGLFVPQAEQIRANGPWLDDDGKQRALGRYTALTVCGECHGMDLQGMADFTPGLAAVIAYSRDDFEKLMREGVAIGGRQLDLMKEVAVRRFAYLTDEEIEALHEYLVSLAGSSGET